MWRTWKTETWSKHTYGLERFRLPFAFRSSFLWVKAVRSLDDGCFSQHLRCSLNTNSQILEDPLCGRQAGGQTRGLRRRAA